MTVRWPSATAGPTSRRTACTDIEFDDAVADPIGQVARVYDAVGLPLTAEARNRDAALARASVPREAARPPYAAGDFGLTDEQIDERFAVYNERFARTTTSQ